MLSSRVDGLDQRRKIKSRSACVQRKKERLMMKQEVDFEMHERSRRRRAACEDNNNKKQREKIIFRYGSILFSLSHHYSLQWSFLLSLCVGYNHVHSRILLHMNSWFFYRFRCCCRQKHMLFNIRTQTWKFRDGF